MSVLIRILLVAGILCLSMNFVGVVVSYYSTLSELSQGSDASVDALTDRASELQRSPWPTSLWTILGVALIITALALWVTRRRSRRQSRQHESAATR
jgi:hypothetical protein